MRTVDQFPQIETLACAYFKLLSSIDWQDKVVVRGLREGLNKFLSNAHLALFRGDKYHKTHYVSSDALQQLKARVRGELVWEHLVPKVYFQAECVRRAKERTLRTEFVKDRLRKFWWTATITADENRLLKPCRAMPESWDGIDILGRYRYAGLDLQPNAFFERIVRQDDLAGTSS